MWAFSVKAVPFRFLFAANCHFFRFKKMAIALFGCVHIFSVMRMCGCSSLLCGGQDGAAA